MLRQPLDRIEYLLKIEGLAGGGHQESSQPGAELLEEVFTLNEELDEIRAERQAGAPAARLRERLEAARRPIDARAERQERQVEELAARWDAQLDARAAAAEASGHARGAARRCCRSAATSRTCSPPSSGKEECAQVVGIDLGTTNSLVACVEDGEARR